MTDEEKKELTGCLLNEQCSCVIRQGQETRIFRERGVKDLFRLLKEPRILRNKFSERQPTDEMESQPGIVYDCDTLDDSLE